MQRLPPVHAVAPAVMRAAASAAAAIRAVPGLFALIIFSTFNNLIGGVYMALMDPYGLTLFDVKVWGIVLGVTSTGFIIGGAIVAKRGLGRNPDHILIMPGVSPFVGRTEEEAREKYERLTSLILEEDGIALIRGLTGGTLDLTGVDLDGPLPPVPPTEGMKSRQALIRQIADENDFSIRQLYQWIASARGL